MPKQTGKGVPVAVVRHRDEQQRQPVVGRRAAEISFVITHVGGLRGSFECKDAAC